VRIITAIAMSAFLLAQISGVACAQPIPGMSPKEKTRYEQKRARAEEADRDYKDMMQRIPDADKNRDPWGNLRTPNAPTSSGKK
jgi:hypothetical protein